MGPRAESLRENRTAQKSQFVHKRRVFVHFILMCAQKAVPLQCFLKKRP